jgi:hypothetical protein
MNYTGMIKYGIGKNMSDEDIIRYIDREYGIHDRGRNPDYVEFDKHIIENTISDIAEIRKEMKNETK